MLAKSAKGKKRKRFEAGVQLIERPFGPGENNKGYLIKRVDIKIILWYSIIRKEEKIWKKKFTMI